MGIYQMAISQSEHDKFPCGRIKKNRLNSSRFFLKPWLHVRLIANDSIQTCSLISHCLEIYTITLCDTKESIEFKQVLPKPWLHVRLIANDSIQTCSLISHFLEIYTITLCDTKESVRKIASCSLGCIVERLTTTENKNLP